ncbi:CHAD domain-containing protein [Phenylobacterium sp. LjRoot219]|uniref:CYTH and CHAD domain-containing protein n=1 Tax=Phenylobacterium sp. LjRoot219 TaxID=3342283 RepID=UPI003ECCA9F3
MSQLQEIELKFLCAPEDLVRVLAAAPAGDDESRELISVYFDTPDLDLQKAGASLRVRESKGQRVQTLKRGDGLAREEHETPISSDAPDPALGPLPDLLPARARGSLKPAFHVRVTRRQRLVRFDGAEIEMALDQGEVRGGKEVSPISELELELKSGDPAALFGLARELSHAAPIYLSFASKAQRGQALVAGCPLHAHRRARVALGKDATVAEVFQAIARSALESIAANAEVLRQRADAEAVHQLRVGARALRSALSTFREVVEDEAFERVKSELRWLAKACDDARNLDVFADETLLPAAKLDPAPPALPALVAEVQAAREHAAADVAQAAASARFRDLLIEVTGWVDTGPWLSRPPAGEPARPFAAKALQKRRRKLLKDGRDLAGLSDEDRHQVRIDAKKLRYAAEGFQGLYGRKGPGDFIKALKSMQDELGALNDLATAETLLNSLGLTPEAAFAAGELVGRKTTDKKRHIAKAAKALDRLADIAPFWG